MHTDYQTQKYQMNMQSICYYEAICLNTASKEQHTIRIIFHFLAYVAIKRSSLQAFTVRCVLIATALSQKQGG